MTARRGDGRVLIVDDHLLIAQTVELALGGHGYQTTSLRLPDEFGPGSTAEALLARILEDPPDVLLVDLDLGPHVDGSALIEPATRAGVGVVVMTDVEPVDRWAPALRAGALAGLAKTGTLAELVDALQDALKSRAAAAS